MTKRKSGLASPRFIIAECLILLALVGCITVVARSLDTPDPMKTCQDRGFSSSTCFYQLNR